MTRNTKVLYGVLVLLFILSAYSLNLNFKKDKEVLELRSIVKECKAEFNKISVSITDLEKNVTRLIDKVNDLKSENNYLKEELEKKHSVLQQAPNEISGSGILFEATAYTPHEVGSTTTAIGVETFAGCIAVDPDVIPLGSSVYIEFPGAPQYNGVYQACDTGGAIQGNIVDVFMWSYDEAMAFGRRDCYITTM